MPQQAHRPAPPTADETTDAPQPVAAETAEAFPPLAALLAKVKSPGMVRADIDALIAAMGRAPAADESLRERADLLLGLMSRDNPVGTEKHGGDAENGEVAGRRLVVAGGSSPKAFEVVEEALHPVAQSVAGAVQGRRVLAARVGVDDRCHPELAHVGEDAVGIVARGRDEGVAFGVHQEFLGHRGLILLARRYFEVERLTARRCDGVNLC